MYFYAFLCALRHMTALGVLSFEGSSVDGERAEEEEYRGEKQVRPV